jgi:ribosomal protein S18 acetylase RimI-like enzyme
MAHHTEAGAVMIRPISPADTPMLLDIVRATNTFRAVEIKALQDVLHDFHAGEHRKGHRAVILERDGEPIAFAYYAPEEITDRTWYLWWIAVSPTTQARGIGGELLRYVEDDIVRANARMLLIPTSTTYESAPKFYRKHRYEQSAMIADYYSDGDHMVIFRKRFDGEQQPLAPG